MDKWVVWCEADGDVPEVLSQIVEPGYLVADTKDQVMQYVLGRIDSVCKAKLPGKVQEIRIRNVQAEDEEDLLFELSASLPYALLYRWRIIKARVLPVDWKAMLGVQDFAVDKAEDKVVEKNEAAGAITRHDVLWDRKLDMQHAWLLYRKQREQEKARGPMGVARLQTPMLHFPAGTPYQEVEAWFDLSYPGGVQALLEVESTAL